MTAANVRKLATDVSEIVLDLEDALLGADALPAELLQSLADELGPLRARLKRQLDALATAKRAAKKPAQESVQAVQKSKKQPCRR